MPVVKYRLFNEGLRPRRTKLQVPGWGGDPQPRASGSHEYAWHCLPFTEGAQYGIELFYPFDTELHVTTRGGQLVFEGDSGADPGTGANRPPFRSFGEQFYTYQILIDFKPAEGYALRIEPHPRFYTDQTDTVPIAVPALIRNWWPLMAFVVFKSPPEGRTHIFRPNEPFAQILIIPEEANVDLVEMDEVEAAERELQSRRIHASRDSLSSHTEWMSTTNTVFDGTYRHIHRAAKAKARREAE